MNGLQLNLNGSARGFQQAAEEAVGISKSMTARMEDDAKRSAAQSTASYVGFWEAAIEKREVSERAALARRVAMEEAAAARVAAATTASYEKGVAAKAAVQAAIAGGHIPESMAGGVASKAGQYAFSGGKVVGKYNAAGEIVNAAGKVVHGLEEVGHAAHGNSIVMRESMVIVRELARGDFKRAASSATILAGALRGAAMALLAPVAAIAAGVAAVAGISELLGGPGVIKTMKARKEAEESDKSLKESTKETGQDLGERVSGLHRLGKITDRDAAQYRKMLKRGGEDDIRGVMNATSSLMKDGTISEQEKKAEAAKKLVAAQREYRAELEATVKPQDRLLMLMQDEGKLKEDLKKAAGDEAEKLRLKTELLRVGKEIETTRDGLYKAVKEKGKPENDKPLSAHVDSLSGAGLFTSSGAVTNPLLDVGQKQLEKLDGIMQGIDGLGRAFNL